MKIFVNSFFNLHNFLFFLFSKIRYQKCAVDPNFGPNSISKEQYKKSSEVYGSIFVNLFAIGEMNFLCDQVLQLSDEEFQVELENQKKFGKVELGVDMDVQKSFNRRILREKKNCFQIFYFKFSEKKKKKIDSKSFLKVSGDKSPSKRISEEKEKEKSSNKKLKIEEEMEDEFLFEDPKKTPSKTSPTKKTSPKKTSETPKKKNKKK